MKYPEQGKRERLRSKWPSLHARFINSFGYYTGISAAFFGILGFAAGMNPEFAEGIKAQIEAAKLAAYLQDSETQSLDSLLLKQRVLADGGLALHPEVRGPASLSTTEEINHISRLPAEIEEELHRLGRQFKYVQDLEAVRKTDLFRIEFVVGRVFKRGSAEVHEQAISELDQLAEKIAEHFGYFDISVEGYTDPSPIHNPNNPYKSNWELSGARAARFLRHLEEKGVESRRLRFVGFGSQTPGHRSVASGDRRIWAPKARRIILVIQ